MKAFEPKILSTLKGYNGKMLAGDLVAGIVHALVLLLILVVLMPYAKWIPMPVIAAILFMVAYKYERVERVC